jgi:uncharacterized protein (DUF885 family)
MPNFPSLRLPLLALIFAAASQTPSEAFQGATQVEKLADEYVGLRSQDGLPDRSQRALRQLQEREDALLAQLKTVAVREARDQEPTYSVLREELESRRDLRVCRSELWDLSQTQGWQIELPALAANQPVATPADRKRALSLWSTLPANLATDIANLREGLASGYSAPKSVVARVVQQLDALASASGENSPFYLPAKRAQDPAFDRALLQEIEGQINPAIQQYAQFLRTEYLPQARESSNLSALPNGLACYQAYLRRNTTTDDTPEFVIALGKKMVADSTAEIRNIGLRSYHSTSPLEIVRRSHDDPKNRFTSSAQLLEFSKEMVERAERMSRGLFLQIPSQPVIVEPLPTYQNGSGVSSHYESNAGDRKSATFWIATDDWENETRGSAEITAVHETVPGHHLQIATARRLRPATKLAKLAFNAAYAEGWANYAERLAEEQNIDGDDYERIQRRVLAGRSLVIDPGIHAFGWSREQAEAFVMETGMSKQQADDVIDRIAVEPGQLTSYEIGGQEILSLREAARKRLGAKFDLGGFHQRVLEQGAIPLNALRSHINAWLDAQ